MDPDFPIAFNESQQVGVDYTRSDSVIEWEDFSKSRPINSDLEKLSLTHGDVFFDIGCGLGHHMNYALRICKFGYGLDPSMKMISKAKQNLKPNKHFELLHKGILRIEVSDFSLTPNKVYSWGAFHHLPDFWKFVALRQLNSILSSGSLFLLADTCWCFAPQEYASYLSQFIESALLQHGESISQQIKRNIEEEFTTFDFLLERIVEESGFIIIDKSVSQTNCFAEFLLKKP